MADTRKRLSELPTSSGTDGLYTLGVNAQNEGVKIPIGELLNANTATINTLNQNNTVMQGQIAKLTPSKVASEELLEQMKKGGFLQAGQIYYVAEED